MKRLNEKRFYADGKLYVFFRNGKAAEFITVFQGIMDVHGLNQK